MKKLGVLASSLPLLILMGCASVPPKPGCAPGWSAPIVEQCSAEMAAGTATQAECDQRIDAKAAECLR